MRISDWSSDVCSSDLRGTPVLGICNGFQVLTATGQLPGALMRNQRLDFVCRDAPLTVENAQSALTSRYEAGETIMIPVAHHDGNYFADVDQLDRLAGEGRVAFCYAMTGNTSCRDRVCQTGYISVDST